MFKKMVTSIAVLCLCIAPSAAFAQTTTEASQAAAVEAVVNNLFTSLNTQDGALYLDSISTADRASYQYVAANLEPTNIEYEIVSTEEISDTKYEVTVQKTENGVEYPEIPYDVIEQNDAWKVDVSNIRILSKDIATAVDAENPTVVSQNENFIIQKGTAPNDNNGITPRSYLTYLIGQESTDIYSPGVLGVETLPGDNGYLTASDNFLVINVYRVDAGGDSLLYNPSASGSATAYKTFAVSGYHKVYVYNMNHPNAGKYNVQW